MTDTAKERGFPTVYIHGDKSRKGVLWYVDEVSARIEMEDGELVTVQPHEFTAVDQKAAAPDLAANATPDPLA